MSQRQCLNTSHFRPEAHAFSNVFHILGHWCVFTRGCTMRVWTSRSARCLLLLMCLGTVRTLEVTILHTNDNHARIEETSEDSGKCRPDRPCFAGVARRFTKVSEIRKKEENVLFLDAGDQFQGTVWFNYYKGAEAAHFMNKLGYDVMVNTNLTCLSMFMCNHTAECHVFCLC